MNMKFSSSYILITFEPCEMFAGLSVRMKGEALWNGFDAALSTMEWIENRHTYSVDDFVKNKVKQLIEEYNRSNDFKILFMEEVL